MFEESVSAIPSIWASINSWFTPAVLFVLLNVMIGTIAFTSTLTNQKQPHHDSPNHSQPHQPRLASSPSVLQRLRSINFTGYRSHEANSLDFHLNQTSDSESHVNYEPSEQSQRFEMQSQHALSQQNLENPASIFEKTREMQGHYFLEQNPAERTQENEESFVYQEAHQQKSPDNGAQVEKFQENADRQSENIGNGSLDEVYSRLNLRHVGRSKSDTKPAAGEVPAKLAAKMKKSASLKSAFKHFEEEDLVEARRPATVKEGSSKAADVDDEVDAKADDFINKFKQQLKLQRMDSITRYKEMVGRGSGR